MAPSLEEPVYASDVGTTIDTIHKLSLRPEQNNPKDDAIVREVELVKDGVLTALPKYEPGRAAVESHDNYEHEDLRPSFPDVHWEPLKEIPYHDKGLLGDPKFRSLLSAGAKITDLVPKIGSVVEGVRLASLTDAQKNDLARLIATRGVVFFKNQDDFDIDKQRELGSYYGTLHKVRIPMLLVAPLA